MRRVWWWGGIGLIALVVVSVHLLAETLAPCPGEGAIAASTELQTVHPQRVVVQPWRGQHQVYAVFAVPGGNRVLLSFVDIPGARRYCTTGFVSTRSLDGVAVPPSSYLLKTYLNTRLALWLWVRGLSQELRQPSHWVTVYASERVNQG